ncbi:MAG TPA: hypothetical protein VMT62_10160 [Syntrophorhabdaceae bacterium]|nr:hypothetical protein [Syntrophorhabdaceae bacterium]
MAYAEDASKVIAQSPGRSSCNESYLIVDLLPWLLLQDKAYALKSNEYSIYSHRHFNPHYFVVL